MTELEMIKVYEQMEKALISSMKRNLKRHKEEEKKVGFKFEQWQSAKIRNLQKYRKENKNIIQHYLSNVDIGQMMSEELKQGKLSAFKDFRDAVENGYKSTVIEENFFKTNSRKANSLIKSVKHDMNKANQATLRKSNDIYREVITKASAYVTNGVYTEKQAIDMAINDFATKGIDCIVYKNGSRHTISDYASMAIRTANTRAMLTGEGELRKELGETLVIISKHGTACDICQKFEDKVFIDDVYSGGTKKDGNYPLLSEAMEQGLYHPNCRHGMGTYFEELEEKEEYELTYKGERNADSFIDWLLHDEKGKQARKKLYSLNRSGTEEHGNERNYELNKILGYDKKPLILNTDEFDKIKSEEIYRGIASEKKHAREYANEFMYGEFYAGKGYLADGTYGAYNSLITAQEYAGEDGVILKMKTPNAKFVALYEVEEARTNYSQSLQNELSRLVKKQKYGDEFMEEIEALDELTTIIDENGFLASIMGYDAIYIDTYDFVCILNRGKVAVLNA